MRRWPYLSWFDREAERESRDALVREWHVQELRAKSLDRLTKLLRQAGETVPFYQQVWREAGLGLDDILQNPDLEHLPLITRRRLQLARSKTLSSVSRRGYLVHTSGTSGRPALFVKDRAARVGGRAALRRFLRVCGVNDGDAAWYVGALTEHGRRNIERWYRASYPYIQWHVFSLDSVPRSGAPQLILGAPQDLETLGKTTQGRLRPRVAVSTGERLDESFRRSVTSSLGAPMFDLYAAREFSVTIGFECGEHTGLHSNADYAVVEVIDSAGRAAPPGELGEVVVTDLGNHVAPLIRYRTGDLARAPLQCACACGRALPIAVGRLEGRVRDEIRKSDGTQIAAGPLIVELSSIVGAPITLVQESRAVFRIWHYSGSYPSADISLLQRAVALYLKTDSVITLEAGPLLWKGKRPEFVTRLPEPSQQANWYEIEMRATREADGKGKRSY